MTDPTETARALLRDAENYLSALHGSVARHDNLAANFGCAGCELRNKIRAALAAASSADRATLRERIAEALMRWAEGNNHPKYAPMRRSETVRANAYSRADAVLSVLPAPAERAAVLTEAERAMLAYALDQAQERIWSEDGFTDEDQAAVTSLRRLADEAPATNAPSSDIDPVYDPRAWETYRRDAGCGCTAPAPVDCKVPHGTGAWLCVCHRLSGPLPANDPGKPLALLGGSISKHFLEPNRCLSTDGIFRCSRPTGHAGGHRTGRTFWGRRPEDDQRTEPAVVEPAEAADAEVCGAREPEPRTGTSPCVLPAGHGGTKHQDKWTNQWPTAAKEA